MKNYKTHTILQPADCKCDKTRNCNICDGGVSFCVVCKGGEIELEQQTCEERQRQREQERNAASACHCSRVVSNCAAILRQYDTPDCQTISSQEKAIAIIQRLLGEIRVGANESHPRAAVICHDLEIGLQEVLTTLRNAKAIVRSLQSLDP